MATSKIAPERLPRYENTIEVRNTRYRFRWVWNNRTSSWYASMYDVDGNPIIEGERVSVGSQFGLGSSAVDFLLGASGVDDFVSWEEWPDGKMTLFLFE
jgi:hypothetical protein